MHDAIAMRVFERVADLREQIDHERRSQLALRLNHPRHVCAIHILHHDVEQAARCAGIKDAHDAGMTELRHRLGFEPETIGEIRLGLTDQGCGQHLDRDRAVQRQLARLIDRAHSAASHQREKLKSQH